MAQNRAHRRLLIPGPTFGLILAIVIFGAAGCGRSTSVGGTSGTATATPAAATATATQATIPDFPLQGWHIGGPSRATAIAFAPGSSTVAYACGAIRQPTVSTGGVSPMFVAISTDGAKTWTTESPDTAESVLCALSVDPTNPHDVVLFTTTCASGCNADPKTHLYRSRDGGQSWAELALPELPADGAGIPYFTNQLAWSGTTLFATTMATISGGKPVQHLLASVNSGPFARVDQATLFGGAGMGRIFSLGTAVYVELFPSGCNFSYFCTLAKTTDGGATWRQISLRYQQQAVDLLAAGGGALIVGTPNGAIEHSALARTQNDGQTWQPLPTGPGGMSYYAKADSTLFLTDLNAGAIYRLSPGGKQWQLAVPGAGSTPTSLDDGSLVFQTDGAGHPVAVWRDAGQDQSGNGAQYPGLQYYSL
jgi:photosystem II stability/assembly factor-like uncharacterized protein